METKGFFQFESIINVLVSAFSFIWIPMLCVYGHCKYFSSCTAVIDFRHQILTSKVYLRTVRFNTTLRLTYRPCSFLLWKRGDPIKLFLMVCRRVLHAALCTAGDPGGVPNGLSVPPIGRLGRGVRGLGRGLLTGDGVGLTPLSFILFLRLKSRQKHGYCILYPIRLASIIFGELISRRQLYHP